MQTVRRRILCAEPHVDTCSLLSFLFTREDYELQRATTIAEALELAKVRRFDLYLLDDQYEDGSALELCEQLCRYDPHTPILFFTTYARESDQQQGLRAGAWAYLVKPGNIFELAETVERLINRAGGIPSALGKKPAGADARVAQEVERRRLRRAYQPFPAVVYGADEGGEELEERALLENFSANGLYLRLSKRVAPSAKLSIVIRPFVAPALNRPPVHVAVNGKVTRTEQRDEGDYGLGIMLQESNFFDVWSWALR
jgi:DNA-binding response OmpR family regulator